MFPIFEQIASLSSGQETSFNLKALIFSYLSKKKYIVGAHHQGASNEYPQSTFLWRNKKKYQIPPLFWSYGA